MVDRIGGKSVPFETTTSKGRKQGTTTPFTRGSVLSDTTLQTIERRLRSDLEVAELSQDTERVVVQSLIEALGLNLIDIDLKDRLIEKVIKKIRSSSELESKIDTLIKNLRTKE